MTVVSRAWGRLTLPGKIVFTIVPLLLVLGLATPMAIILLGPLAIQVVSDNLPLVRFVVAATAVLLVSIPIAFMNLRIRPDRASPPSPRAACTPARSRPPAG